MPGTGRNNERTERISPRNRKLVKVEPLHQQVESLDKNYNSLAKFSSENPYPVLRIHLDGTILYANKASEPLLKAKETAVSLPAPPEWRQLTKEVLSSGQVMREETAFAERIFGFMVVPIAENKYANFYGTDITEQKIAQEEREITIKLLSLINSRNHIHDLMKLVTVFLKDWSGCEAVGIRLKEGEDFPYFETNGFSDEFIKAESKLCSVNEFGEPIRDSQGRVFLECMCGNIISGRFDPSKPFFTKHGSFWSNCTTELLAGTTSADRMAKTRNRCNTAGYESVALVPLRAGKETFGLLQFNSKQKNKFTHGKISLFERLADNLAIGLAQRKVEQELRESEDKFRHVFDNSAIGKSITFISGEMQANRALCEMLGYSQGKLQVKKWQEVTHSDDIEENQKAIDSLISGQKDSVHLIKRYIHKNGSVVWANVGASLRRDSKGKPLYFMTTMVDITERKQAEEQYQMLFREMLNGFALHKIICDKLGRPVDYQFLAVNPAFERFTGLKAKDIIGKTVREILPGIEQKWIDIYGRVALTGEPAFFEDYTGAMDRHFQVTAFRPVANQFACIFADITKRKSAEEELLWKTAFLESQVEANLDGLLVVDSNNKRILTNKRLIELFKVPQHILEDKDDTSLLQYVVSQVKCPEQFLEKVEYLYSHQDQTTRDELEFKNGMIFDRYSSPVVDKNGKYLGRVWTFRDITERKQAEVELKKHLDELISWQNLTIGREGRVMELKKEVNELLAKLGQPPRYEQQDT